MGRGSTVCPRSHLSLGFYSALIIHLRNLPYWSLPAFWVWTLDSIFKILVATDPISFHIPLPHNLINLQIYLANTLLLLNVKLEIKLKIMCVNVNLCSSVYIKENALLAVCKKEEFKFAVSSSNSSCLSKDFSRSLKNPNGYCKLKIQRWLCRNIPHLWNTHT